MKLTLPSKTILSTIPGALSFCTVCFYENASCTQTPDWPAYEWGWDGDEYGDVWNSGCQQIEASIEAGSFTLACA